MSWELLGGELPQRKICGSGLAEMGEPYLSRRLMGWFLGKEEGPSQPGASQTQEKRMIMKDLSRGKSHKKKRSQEWNTVGSPLTEALR